MKFSHWIAAVWLVCATAVGAQDVPSGIFVQGQGRVAVEPDMATINLGVRQRAENATEAVAATTAAVAEILSTLDAQGIAAQDRQTSRFYLNPVYGDTSSPGNDRAVIGYEAGNAVTVTVRDLDQLGPIMDAVIAVGANEFNGLSFGLEDDSAAMDAARVAAVADAMSRAKLLAEAAGIALGDVVQVSDSVGSVGGPQMGMAQARMAMEAAIAPGELDIRAQVSMVFAIAPAAD